jgi:hypothetical protein
MKGDGDHDGDTATPPAPRAVMLWRRAHLSRLGAGLVIVGGAGVAHALWGVAVDLPLLVVGASGLLWALATRQPAHLLAAIVLVAVALFALLDDHGVFTGLSDALTLLVLAVLAVLAHGLPVLWREAWPLVPAGVLVLLAAFVLIRLAAAWAAAPWTPAAPLLVALAGLTLLVWDARGGRAP